ncbi:DUF4240 domain-containing protein [Actinoplanes sp. NPDC023714]|uniref:DUF4240 domain-containing protein n=1 Tax=Actinoplanes sp. NPDC023714 TaxID=3154322 RepID=UPI00340A8ADA
MPLEDTFWDIVERARLSADDPDDVARHTVALLTTMPAAEVAALRRPLHDLMASSYRWDLWQAAYLINGGCSDDGFEYFRGWLIAQGRDVYERAVRDPDSLSGLPVIREEEDLECEDMCGVVVDAYRELTGSTDLPPAEGRYPDLGPGWDFDDDDEVRRRLPRLAALFLD